MNEPPSLDTWLERYESACRGSRRPHLASFWRRFENDVPASSRLEILHELIKVELELQWSRANGRGILIEEYATLLSELGPAAGWPADVISEEWRVRWRWGDKPPIEEYTKRFPNRPDLEITLRRVHDETIREWRNAPAALTQPTPPLVADSRAPLDYRDFVLAEFLGSGGVGKVYRAFRKGSEYPLAVKMLRKSRWTAVGGG